MNKLLALIDGPARGQLTPSARQAPNPPSATQLIVSRRPPSRVIVSGMIRSIGTVIGGGSPAFHFTLVDGSGELDVLFLGQRNVRGLEPGTRVTVEGRLGSHDGKLALWNPRYWIEPAD